MPDRNPQSSGSSLPQDARSAVPTKSNVSASSSNQRGITSSSSSKPEAPPSFSLSRQMRAFKTMSEDDKKAKRKEIFGTEKSPFAISQPYYNREDMAYENQGAIKDES